MLKYLNIDKMSLVDMVSCNLATQVYKRNQALILFLCHIHQSSVIGLPGMIHGLLYKHFSFSSIRVNIEYSLQYVLLTQQWADENMWDEHKKHCFKTGKNTYYMGNNLRLHQIVVNTIIFIQNSESYNGNTSIRLANSIFDIMRINI